MVACGAAHHSRCSFPHMMLSRTPRLGDVMEVHQTFCHGIWRLFAASGHCIASPWHYYYELKAPCHDRYCLPIAE